MLATLTGAAASALSGFAAPSHAFYVATNTRRPADRDGVLDVLPNFHALLLAVIGGLWSVYGIHTGAVWATVTALVDLAAWLVIAACVTFYGRPGRRAELPAAVIGFGATAVLAVVLPLGVLGAVAATASCAMWVPSAVSLVLRRKDLSDGMSLTTATLVLVSNLLWLAYGVLLWDLWLTIPAVFHVASGAVSLAVLLYTHAHLSRTPGRAHADPGAVGVG